ncbi:MAG: hypothetical protein HY566_01790 [Candidatus Kerfeldbacteria bacterium]|nr:hypothetical protein [Candidatus Kerfeldbacteria bacterium]
MRTKSFRLTLFVTAALLLVVLFFSGAFGAIGGWAAAILGPIGRALTSLTPGGSPGSTKDVQVLEDTIARLLVENVRLKDERESTKADADLSSWLAQRALRGEVAHVIGQTPESGDSMLIIDRGSERKIQKGAPVLLGNGVLLGVVEDARSYRSTVLPVTSPRSLIAATVDNGRKTPGLVRGEHGLTMSMESIPQNEPLETGQAVVTSNLNERIPESLLLGTIQNVTLSVGDVFQKASVLPILDLRRARSVVIIISER